MMWGQRFAILVEISERCVVPIVGDDGEMMLFESNEAALKFAEQSALCSARCYAIIDLDDELI